jgi:hypothetical protein
MAMPTQAERHTLARDAGGASWTRPTGNQVEIKALSANGAALTFALLCSLIVAAAKSTEPTGLIYFARASLWATHWTLGKMESPADFWGRTAYDVMAHIMLRFNTSLKETSGASKLRFGTTGDDLVAKFNDLIKRTPLTLSSFARGADFRFSDFNYTFQPINLPTAAVSWFTLQQLINCKHAIFTTASAWAIHDCTLADLRHLFIFFDVGLNIEPSSLALMNDLSTLLTPVPPFLPPPPPPRPVVLSPPPPPLPPAPVAPLTPPRATVAEEPPPSESPSAMLVEEGADEVTIAVDALLGGNTTYPAKARTALVSALTAVKPRAADITQPRPRLISGITDDIEGNIEGDIDYYHPLDDVVAIWGPTAALSEWLVELGY